MSEKKVNYGSYEEKYGAYSSIGFFPIKDRVLVLPMFVKPLPRKSDIILADNVSEDLRRDMQTWDKYPIQGIVVAVGPGFDATRPSTLRPGMRVYMDQPWEIDEKSGQLMSHRAFLFNKMMYYRCQEGNIIGVVEGDIDDPRKDVPMSPLTKE